MFIVQYLTKLLKGRGFFASFLVISGWGYSIILIVVLIVELFLYVLGIKYKDNPFKISTDKKHSKKE